ncbi:MAG: hypothetical protein ABI822_16730 [Bryobacteraceae bacterium]
MTKSKMMIALAFASVSLAAEWTAPVHVLHEFKPCVTYRAKLDGEYLVIQATIQPGWHSFAMDNERRADEKRAGKPSLGIDQPTVFKVQNGLELAGPWYQTPPRDFSKPEIRWYSWGFEQEATFVAKVRRAGAGPATIGIRGQACTDKTCKNIDVSLPVPLTGPVEATTTVDLKALVQTR